MILILNICNYNIHVKKHRLFIIKSKRTWCWYNPSKYKNKKVGVFKKSMYLCSIGDTRYLDFPYYVMSYELSYAWKRKKLYQLRHHKESDKIGTAGYYAYNILW